MNCPKCGKPWPEHTTGGCPKDQVWPSERAEWLAKHGVVVLPPDHPIHALQEKAQALVDALDRCKPTLDGYAVLAYVHGERYQGATFGNEWEALRAALAVLRGDLK